MNVLRKLNTHGVGYAGLVGISTVVAAVTALFNFLHDSANLLELYHEHKSHTYGSAWATLDADLFYVLGATIVFSLGLYFGRPKDIPSDPATPPAPDDKLKAAP